MFYKRVPRKMLRNTAKKHPIICSKCGAADNVSFSPKGIAPVLCRRCFRKKKREDKQKRFRERLQLKKKKSNV